MKFTYEIEDNSEVSLYCYYERAMILRKLYMKNQYTMICICTDIFLLLNHGKRGTFNPIQDRPFWGCSRMGQGTKKPFSIKSVMQILQ